MLSGLDSNVENTPTVEWTTALQSGTDDFRVIDSQTVKVQVTSFVLAGVSEYTNEPVTYVRLSSIIRLDRSGPTTLVLLSRVEAGAPLQRSTLTFSDTASCGATCESLRRATGGRVPFHAEGGAANSLLMNPTVNSSRNSNMQLTTPPRQYTPFSPSPRAGSVPAPEVEAELAVEYPAYAPRSSAGPPRSSPIKAPPPSIRLLNTTPAPKLRSSPIMAPEEVEGPPPSPEVPKLLFSPIKIPAQIPQHHTSALLDEIMASHNVSCDAASSSSSSSSSTASYERPPERRNTYDPDRFSQRFADKPRSSWKEFRSPSNSRRPLYVSRFADPNRSTTSFSTSYSPRSATWRSTSSGYTASSDKRPLWSRLRYRDNDIGFSPLRSYSPDGWAERKTGKFPPSPSPGEKAVTFGEVAPAASKDEKEGKEKKKRKKHKSPRHQEENSERTSDSPAKDASLERASSQEKKSNDDGEGIGSRQISNFSLNSLGLSHDAAQSVMEGTQQLIIPQIVIKHNIRGSKHPKEVYVFVTLDKTHVVTVKVTDFLDALESSGMLKRYRVQRRAVGDLSGERGIPLVGVRDINKAQTFFKGKCRALALSSIVRVTLGTEELYVEQDAVLCRRPRFSDRSRLVCILTPTHGFFLEFNSYEKAAGYADALNAELEMSI